MLAVVGRFIFFLNLFGLKAKKSVLSVFRQPQRFIDSSHGNLFHEFKPTLEGAPSSGTRQN
jgi:hypothetical protein